MAAPSPTHARSAMSESLWRLGMGRFGAGASPAGASKCRKKRALAEQSA
jgi:hypothetical protein